MNTCRLKVVTIDFDFQGMTMTIGLMMNERRMRTMLGRLWTMLGRLWTILGRLWTMQRIRKSMFSFRNPLLFDI